jgi:hypothetical protein
MKSDKQLVTIDLAPLGLIEKDGDRFMINPKAEDTLIKWKDFLKLVKEVDDTIKEKLSESMDATNTLKVEGDRVKVVKQYYGAKYELTDPDLALHMGFAVLDEPKRKIESKVIDKYIKDNGYVPESVKLRERTRKVTIKVEGDEDDES